LGTGKFRERHCSHGEHSVPRFENNGLIFGELKTCIGKMAVYLKSVDIGIAATAMLSWSNASPAMQASPPRLMLQITSCESTAWATFGALGNSEDFSH